MSSQNLERTEGMPGMSVKVPEFIVSKDVAEAIASRMPDMGFTAAVRTEGVKDPVVVFEHPDARGVFTNVVNVAITFATDKARIKAVENYFDSRVSK